MTPWWRTPDGLAIAGGATVFVVALAWSIVVEGNVRAVASGLPTLNADAEHVSADRIKADEADRVRWADPAEGTTPDTWVFDVFTPPVIYYDRETGRFSVSPPEVTAPGDEDVLAKPFGVALLRVVRQPYRLQLVGYSGTTEEPLGIFADQISGDGIVARAGDAFSSLELELRSLVIQREDLIVPHSMPLREIVAVADVWDTKARKMVRLSSARPAWVELPVAEVRIEQTGEVRTVQTGSRIETGDGIFEFVGVFSGPDTVTAVKHLPTGTQETIRLVPEPPPEVQFGGDTIF